MYKIFTIFNQLWGGIMPILTSKTIKDGIFNRIVESFPAIVVYDEPMRTALKFPHFFINQMTTNIRPSNYNHWYVDYFGTVRFRFADQPELVSNINQQLDFIALALSAAFLDYINVDGVKFRINQTQPSEKIDGVLHWFWSVTVSVTREQAEEVKQMQLEQNFVLRSE